jgi:AraC-like DNA-binding protein
LFFTPSLLVYILKNAHLCVMNHLYIPFQSTRLSQPESRRRFEVGGIISTFNKCGFFLCLRGEVEVKMDDRTFVIRPGDLYIYVASTLVHLLRKSADADGVLFEVDLDYLLPIVNKVMNVEALLSFRAQPCVSLNGAQREHLTYLVSNLWNRLHSADFLGNTATIQSESLRNLQVELVRSMGQVLCYEILYMYFSIRPVREVQPSRQDQIFQNFLVALFHHYREEREVAYYAEAQHLTPRYLSAVIKERTGSSALQWIVQMVTSEAKHLLLGSEMSIKEIAAWLNFPTQSFFGKYFKQYVGVSPKDYRETSSVIS